MPGLWVLTSVQKVLLAGQIADRLNNQHLHVSLVVQQAQVRVIAQTDNVAGVRIPKFEQHNMSGESKMNLTGLGKGGQQVQQCRKVGGLLVLL